MTFIKIEIHNRNLEARKKSFLKDNKIPEEEKKDIMEFLRLGSLGKINLRKNAVAKNAIHTNENTVI